MKKSVLHLSGLKNSLRLQEWSWTLKINCVGCAFPPFIIFHHRYRKCFSINTTDIFVPGIPRYFDDVWPAAIETPRNCICSQFWFVFENCQDQWEHQFRTDQNCSLRLFSFVQSCWHYQQTFTLFRDNVFVPITAFNLLTLTWSSWRNCCLFREFLLRELYLLPSGDTLNPKFLAWTLN